MLLFRTARLLCLAALVITTAACRRDPSETSTTTTGSFGGAGAGFTTQCSGWFPDWICSNPPPANVDSFQWPAFDFHVPAQRLNYLDTLKQYLLLGMDTVDFVAQKNTQRAWYHVPMMTTSPFSRREPYRGTTKERPLFASSHNWIVVVRPSGRF